MMQFTHTRKAFSMITAIFVILLMATVGGFIMNLSGKMVQETTMQYRKEQSILYAKSYTEYAIMAATAKPCVKKIVANIAPTPKTTNTKKGHGYYVEVLINYIGTPACDNHLTSGDDVKNPGSIQNVILVDTFVHYRDPDHPSSTNSFSWEDNPGYTYHRRTLQKL